MWRAVARSICAAIRSEELTTLPFISIESLPARAFEMGEYFMRCLRDMNSPHVAEVRGKGLLIGVEVKKSSGKARPFCEKLMDLGLLCKETHEAVVRFAPPLVIEKEEIDWAMDRIRKVFA